MKLYRVIGGECLGDTSFATQVFEILLVRSLAIALDQISTHAGVSDRAKPAPSLDSLVRLKKEPGHWCMGTVRYPRLPSEALMQ